MAVGIAAAAAAGANLLGSFSASSAQQKSAKDALKFQKQMYADQQARMAPYYAAGTKSLGDLQRLLADPSSIENDPSYQFRYNQGEQALNSNLAARGNLLGGGALKELTRYGQGFASQEFQNQFNRLASLAGIGQSAAGSMNASSANLGANASELLTGMGNSQAASYLGAAGALNNGLNTYLNYNLNSQLLNAYGGNSGKGGQ